MRTAFALTAVLALSASAQAAETWKIDPAHSVVDFSVRHMMISNVRGEFGKVSGTVVWDEKSLANSKIEAEIDVSSVNTREAKRDEHLRSADFFDAANHPTMTFTSTSIEKAGKGKLRAKGMLTLRGVTKPVVMEITGPTKPVQNPWGMTVMGASATGKLNRKDFNIVWNQKLDKGGVAVGDEVEFTINVELIREQPQPTKAER